MFKKNAFLAVVGDDDDFWLCRVVKKVELSARFLKLGGLFDVNWLENDGGGDAAVYSVARAANAVELKSVVTRVHLKRRKDGRDVEQHALEQILFYGWVTVKFSMHRLKFS